MIAPNLRHLQGVRRSGKSLWALRWLESQRAAGLNPLLVTTFGELPGGPIPSLYTVDLRKIEEWVRNSRPCAVVVDEWDAQKMIPRPLPGNGLKELCLRYPECRFLVITPMDDRLPEEGDPWGFWASGPPVI